MCVRRPASSIRVACWASCCGWPPISHRKPLHNAPRPQTYGRLLNPSPGRPLRNAPRPRGCGGSCSLSWETFAQLAWSSKVRPLLIPLLGERVRVRGLPGTQPRVTQRSLLGERVGVRVFRATIPGFRKGLLWERVGACPGLNPGVRGLPVSVHAPAPAYGRQCPRGAALFTLSKETFAQPPWSSNLRPLLLPLPVRPLQNAPRPRKRGGSCSLSWETFAQLAWSSKVRPLLIPLLGERVRVRGLPGTQPRVTQRSLWERVGVRGLPGRGRPRPGVFVLIPLLGERVRVRGLPSNHPVVTQRSLQGERQIRASSAEIGEGSSGQPAPCHPNTVALRSLLAFR